MIDSTSTPFWAQVWISIDKLQPKKEGWYLYKFGDYVRPAYVTIHVYHHNNGKQLECVWTADKRARHALLTPPDYWTYLYVPEFNYDE